MKKSDLNFLHVSEKMKNILRHSYTSAGRKESDADHSWRMSLMALVFCPKGLDRDKCIRLAIVHDLCEVYAGDTYALSPHSKKDKHEREKKSLAKLVAILPGKTIGKEIISLWNELEELKTPEARFVKALDKIEVLIQHNESNLKTWAKEEKEIHYGLARMQAERFGFLEKLAGEIDLETGKKLLKEKRKITREEFLKFFPEK